MSEKMMIGKLKELIKDIPNDVVINVLNEDGKSTANIDFWFENLETRQFVDLIGYKPFYEMENVEIEQMQAADEYCWFCGTKKATCNHD